MQVVDIPARTPLPHAFTTANAREMALRAKQARINREQAAKAAISQLAKVTPQCEQVADEMKRLQGLIADTEDADTIAKLSAALERQFKMWQVLSGTPNPGARRSSKRDKPAQIQPEPIAAQAPQIEPVKCNTQGYNGPETG